MKTYILRSDGAYASFVGMSPDEIVSMLAEQRLTCEFIDQDVFEAAVSQLKAREADANHDTKSAKGIISDKALPLEDRFNALISILGM